MSPERTTFELLLSPLGQQAILAASDLAPTKSTYLTATSRLRKHFPQELACLALDTVLLRQKGAAKFSRAHQMYFTREALEVSSGERISAHRAQRFRKFGQVADFGCGIGADAIGLTSAGVHIVAIDQDDVRVRMAEANLSAYECSGRATFQIADLLIDRLPDVPAAFADPGRRANGMRFLSLADYLPPPVELLKRLPSGFPIAFKLAPGLKRIDFELFDGEVEFISVNGELKECVLWLGELRSVFRRATLLLDSETHTLTADRPVYLSEPAPIAGYLFDPNSAVTRADLVPVLAELGSWNPIDAIVQLLSGDMLVATPFATAYRVEFVLPFDARSVLAEIRRRNIGRITVVNRGSLADVEAATQRWKLTGDQHRFLILTRQLGKQVAVLAERV
jgi:hypothetical protein